MQNMQSVLSRRALSNCGASHVKTCRGTLLLQHGYDRPSYVPSAASSSTSTGGSTSRCLPANLRSSQQQEAVARQARGIQAFEGQRPRDQQLVQHCWQTSAILAAAALLTTAGAADAAQELHSLADLDAATAHSLESILRPLFAAFTVLYIIRIPMTWYPSIDGTKLPWLLAYAPTEPFLKATRSVIPLVGGVDITPIVWVGLISFFNEILLGPQGILMLIQRESGAGLL